MMPVELAAKYAALCEEMAAKEADPVRKAELLKIAEVNRWVPEHPARTFYEAVQAVHFVTFALSFIPLRHSVTQYQLGHPDRYLYPYYQADIAAGRITPDFAQLLLDCLGIQINRRVTHGLSCGYMVGGRDGEGNIVAYELTVMGMQVIDNIRLVYPSVDFAIPRECPRTFSTPPALF
jgi:formate C-acetyltransferase